MPNISCDAVKCVFNINGGCSRNQIEVEENCDNVCKCCESYCGSFSDKSSSLKNSTCTDGCPCKDSEIECEVTNCVFNENEYCKAQGIHVGNSSASTSGETECDTFREKQ